MLSAYIQYILYSSAANKAASSPPAPPRISTTTFLSSFSSFGRSKIFNSSSSCAWRSFASFISSFAKSLISSSDSSSRIIKLSSIVSLHFLYSSKASTIGSRSLCSFINFLYLFWSLTTSGLVSCSLISLNLSTIASNLSNIILFLSIN